MARLYSSIEDSEPVPPRPECPDAEDGCSCPLCPKDLALNPRSGPIWFPDEAICPKREHSRLPWVRVQKRIARVGAPTDRYFTIEMLEAVIQVRKGIEGVSPDQPIALADQAEQTWIEQHKGRASRE